MRPQRLVMAIALAAGLAGCAGARRPPGVFRVAKVPTAGYTLASPAPRAEPVPFPRLMEQQYGFQPGAGYIDLLPGMRVNAQRAYFRGADLKLSDYLGAETAHWTIEGGGARAMRFRFTASEAEPRLEKPASAPPVASLIPARRGRLRFYRMFFQVRWFAAGRDSARGSVILGAPDRAGLDAATRTLLAEKPVDCGPRLDCIVFPPATTVTAETGIIVNGEPRWVAWGTTVKMLVPPRAAESLRIARRWGKAALPVEFPRAEEDARAFPLLPGDRVDWDAAQAGEAAAANIVTLSSDGGIRTPLEYDTRGTGGTALVFIHCWACDREFWREQVDVFAADYRVVTLDLTGHGQFVPPEPPRSVLALAGGVEAVVKQLGLTRAILVGHSMGGPVALEAARRLKGIVRGVVLVDTLHNPAQRATAEMVSGIAAGLEADFKGTMEKMVASQFPAGSNDLARNWVIARAVKAHQATALSLMRDYPNLDFGALLAGAGVPLRAINTANPPTDIAAARRFAPDFEAVIVPGVGHFLQLEKPAEFNRRLRAVLTAFD